MTKGVTTIQMLFENGIAFQQLIRIFCSMRNASSIAIFFQVCCCMTSTASQADDAMKVYPEHSITAPSGAFVVEQRSGADEPAGWETWINPAANHQPSYQLKLWHQGMIDWAGRFFISRNERYLLHLQKTGSGDNYGALFARGKDGKFALINPGAPAPPLSERAWDYFREKTGREARCYHAGIEFVSWGADGKCLEISLHGTDVGEVYYIRDWKLHYNLQTHRFFQTRDQLHANQGAIVIKRSDDQ